MPWNLLINCESLPCSGGERWSSPPKGANSNILWKKTSGLAFFLSQNIDLSHILPRRAIASFFLGEYLKDYIKRNSFPYFFLIFFIISQIYNRKILKKSFRFFRFLRRSPKFLPFLFNIYWNRRNNISLVCAERLENILFRSSKAPHARS